MQFEQKPVAKQAQQQTQRLALSGQMRQSLEILRLPLEEMRSLLEQAIEENPLLEIEPEPVTEDDPFLEIGTPATEEWKVDFLDDETTYFESHAKSQFLSVEGLGTKNILCQQEQSFAEMLREQLITMKLPPDFFTLCEYLIDCLNGRGYLEFDLNDLAYETQTSVFEVTQALYLLQSLQPTGVGARSLGECLLLQLVEGQNFNQHTIKIVKDGLPLLAQNNLHELSALLNCTPVVANAAANAVRALNPVPSRGYYTGENIIQIIPDAMVARENNCFQITMNARALPKLELSNVYCDMLKTQREPTAQAYLQQKKHDADNIIKAVDSRLSTLQRVVECVVKIQPQFFKDGASLLPMTLANVADQLGLHISTVSRAVQDKYIVCAAGTINLKSLFSTGLTVVDGAAVSNVIVRKMIKKCIDAETPKAPLSDEAIRLALQGLNITISRRTVAKYREEMGIEKAARRKRR